MQKCKKIQADLSPNTRKKGREGGIKAEKEEKEEEEGWGEEEKQCRKWAGPRRIRLFSEPQPKLHHANPLQ